MDKQNEKRILSYFRLNEKERLNCFLEESALEILKTKQFAVGHAHLAVINEDGTVSAFGSNELHQCDTQEWTSIIKIAAGDFHTVGLKSDGTVVAAGDNRFGQCNVGEWRGITEIYADRGLTVGVDAEGQLCFSKEAEAEKPQPVEQPVTIKTEVKKTVSQPVIDSAAVSQKSSPFASKWKSPFSPQKKSSGFSDGNFEYDKMSDNTLRITKYIGNDSDVTVPSNVVSIGYRVFFENKTVETINLPNSIQLIGSEAFALCPRLKTLVLPDRILQIGKDIVYENTTLICSAGSKTANLLKQKGIPFQTK